MSGETSSLPATLVRLKVRLLVNRARVSTRTRTQLVLSLVLTLLVGGFGFLGATRIGGSTDLVAEQAWLVLGASAICVGWAVLPLLTFGTDESLDPGRLVLFPLERRPLMTGLLLAAFVGPAPLAVSLVVLGTAVGLVSHGGGLVAVAAAVLLLALSASASRALAMVLAARLNSRRGRDLVIVVVSVLALSLQFVRFIDFSSVHESTLHRVDTVLRWFPPAMLGQAALDAQHGQLARGLLELVPAIVLIPALLWVWAWALDRSVTVVRSGETSTRRRRAREDSPLLFRRLGFLAAGPWGAVAAKELRYVAREPRRKVTLVNSVIIGVGVPVWVAVRSSGDARSRAVLLATLAGYVAVLSSSNQFGFDGAAAWVDVVATRSSRTVLVGKNLAVVLEVMPIVVVVGTGVAALTGGWAYLPGAIVFALAGLGAGLGIADNVSVRFPIRLPESRSPFASNAGGQGCATSIILMLCALAQNIMLVPIGIGALVVAVLGPGLLVIVAPLCALYGGALWWGGLVLADRYGTSHRPELLAKVDPRRE